MNQQASRRETAYLILTAFFGAGAVAVLYACTGSSVAPPPAGVIGTTAYAATSISASAAATASASCDGSKDSEGQATDVRSAVDAFAATLTPSQNVSFHLPYTLANAEQWSNFPAAVVRRNGVRLGDLSPAAQAAAASLVRVAAGTTGANLFDEIRAADNAFAVGNHDSGMFGDGNYYVAVLGTPGPGAPWMLQIGGHHVAYNSTYGGRCTSATPLFDGAQPATWKDEKGVAHAPLETQRSAFATLLGSLASSPNAKLAGVFTDMVNGPGDHGGDGDHGPGGPDGSGGPHGPAGPGGPRGRRDGGPPDHGPGDGGAMHGTDARYPSALTYPSGTQGRGVLVSSLSDAQKTEVRAVIEAWVKNVPDAIARTLLSTYESDDALGQTYVGYSGAADLSTTRSYARVDGPRVWIEITIQEGTTGSLQGHYHAVWRDKAADYGADFIR